MTQSAKVLAASIPVFAGVEVIGITVRGLLGTGLLLAGGVGIVAVSIWAVYQSRPNQ